MRVSDLAEEIRRWTEKEGGDDWQVINDFLACPQCGQRKVDSDASLRAIIYASKDPEYFLRICAVYDSLNAHKHGGSWVPDFFDTSTLKERGWTDALIRDLLTAADRTAPNSRFKSRPPMRLYIASRVEEAESSEKFLEERVTKENLARRT